MPAEINESDWIVPNGGIDESVSALRIEDKKWSSGDDAEPLPDGVRRRRGMTKSLNNPVGAVTISNDTGTDTRSLSAVTDFPAGLTPYMWFKADAITGVADGAAVTSWPDSSGNGRNLGAKGGTVTFQTNEAAGQPAVLFESNGFFGSIVGSPHSLFAMTVFHVWKRKSGATGTALNLFSNGGSTDYFQVANGGTERQWHLKSSSAPGFVADSPNTFAAGGSGDTDSESVHVMVMTNTDTLSADPSDISFHKDGVSLGVATGNDYGASDSEGTAGLQPNPSHWTQFYSYSGAASDVEGYVFEVIVFDTALSSGDRQLVEAYLSAKYAVGVAANYQFVSQGFTVGGSPITALGFQVLLKVASGSPTGTVKAAIYANSSGVPGTVVTGANFGDFTTVDVADLTAAYLLYSFTLTSLVTLSASTTYHIVLWFDGDGGTIGVEESTSGNPYAGGTEAVSPDGVNWSAVTLGDLRFRILEGLTGYLGFPITGIHEYRKSDGTVDKHMLAAGKNVYVVESGTARAVNGADLLTSDVDELYAFTNALDRAFVTNGRDLPKKYWIDGSAVERWANEGVGTPTATITATAAAGGSVPDGTYYVDWRYINLTDNIPSNSRYAGANTLSVVLGGGNNTIDIGSIPAAAVRTYDYVTHVEIYLKLSGTDTVFKFQQRVTLGTTTASITSRNSGTVLEQDYDVPPKHSIKEYALNRHFIAGIDGIPWRVGFSRLDGAEINVEAYPPLNYRDFGKGEGDEVTFLKFMPPTTMIVGFKNKIRAFDASQPEVSDVEHISDNIGVAGLRSGEVFGRTFFFLSAADDLKGFFLWNGAEVAPVPGIDTTLKSYAATRLRLASCEILSPGDGRFQIWTLITSSGSQHNRVLLWDGNLNAWSRYRLGKAAAVLGGVEEQSVKGIFLGGYDGYERQGDTGTTDDGVAITGSITMKAFTPGSPDVIKKLRFVNAALIPQTSGAISVVVGVDFGGKPSISGSLSHTGSSAGVLGVDTWDDFLLGGDTEIMSTLPIRGAGRVFQPILSGNVPWHIRGLSMGFQLTGRRS